MHGEDHAATSSLGLLFGAGILVIVVGAGVYGFDTVQNKAESVPEISEADAESLARLLAETPGFPENWPELNTVLQVGLAKAGERHVVDPEKVRLLHGSHPDALTPGRVTDAFHLEPGTGFRIRIHPHLAAAHDGGLAQIARLNVTYVLPEGTIGEPTLRELATLANVTGMAPALAGAAFDPAGSADAFPADAALARRLPPRLWGFEAVEALSGSGLARWQVVPYAPSGPAAVTPGEDAERVLAFTGDDAWGYETGESARLVVTRLDLQNLSADGRVHLELRDWVNGSVQTLPLGGTVVDEGWVEILDCTATCSASEWTRVDSLQATDATRPMPLPADFPNRTVDLTAHRGRIVWLALRWHTNITDAPLGAELHAGEGWVVDRLRIVRTLGAAERVLYENAFDGTGPRRAQTLVLGSDVDQSVLRDAGLRDAIQTNVRHGLGLVALGSEGLDPEWLAPRIQANRTTGSGTSLHPERNDLSHPVLDLPHDLTFLATPGHPRAHAAATYPGGGAFATALYLRSASGGDALPLLSASSPNGEFEGGVVLTSYRPGAWASELDRTHALVNFLAYAHLHGSVVDFGGEPVPAHLPFAASRLTVVAADASLGSSRLELTVVLWR